MTGAFTVACIQNAASDDIAANIEETTEFVRAARAQGADLVCLAEHFTCIAGSERATIAKALPEDAHPALPHFRALAKELKAWLALGSLAIKVAPDRIANRSYLIDAAGAVVAAYDKIYLFDVALARGETYRESNTVRPGGKAVLAPTPWGLMGLSVCYDVRFAALYRSLAQAGARALLIPAAFTKRTGEAHWHVLVRARAIETGSYVFAAAQGGTHAGGRKTYGHSLIVDPWGRVLADGGEAKGHILAEIDPARADEARRMIPALTHDRAFTGPAPATVAARKAAGA